MLGVGRQRVQELPPITKHVEAARTEEHHPRLEHLRVGPPRPRTRRAADRQLPQPLVDHRRRPCAVLVLETQIIVDQHRHTRTDHRAVAQIPLVTAVRCRRGDTLVVIKLDRLARSVPDTRSTIYRAVARAGARTSPPQAKGNPKPARSPRATQR